MRKLLTILGAVTLVAYSSSSVIACNNPGPDPVIKQDLTDELLKEFVNEIGEINYEGPFIFEEGYQINDEIIGTESIIGHLALEQFYVLINENFNYKGYSFIHGSTTIISQEMTEISNNVKYSFEAFFRFRSNNEFNEFKNGGITFKFNFTQTEQYNNKQYLDVWFNSIINQELYKNNKGMTTTRFEKTNIFNILSMKVTTSELNEIVDQQLKLDKIKKEIEDNIKRYKKTQEKSILNLVDINVVDVNLLDEYNESRDLYSLNLRISMKDNKDIYLEKEINTLLKKVI
ncbi:lipoprotein [Spiroplasma endosymbiont of Cantharis nigra]|uniref:lipoprotein n=1 Tax=Spiroplasma endosymbiont of Cantharis nigra TaxID=3066278 RepID=UPI0030D0639C